MEQSSAQYKIQLEKDTNTQSTPDIKANAVQNIAGKNLQEISSALEDTSMLFIMAGMGGTAGSGFAPLIACRSVT